MKMKIIRPFFFLSILLLGACNKSENTLIVRDQQISNLVVKAETESDTMIPQFDSKKSMILWNQLGFTNDYLINTENIFFKSSCNNSEDNHIAKNSILAKINWNDLSNTQFNKLYTLVELFANQQDANIQKASNILKVANDSLASYIQVQNRKLSERIITKVQYDQIMTDVQDTFLTLIRSMYVEQKILISSSTNYRCLLTEIQNTLTEKQWEEFFSCVYKK